MASQLLVFGQDITGEWYGALKVQGMQLRLVFHIAKNGTVYSATMDSPDQGAKDIPMSKVTFENPVLTVEMAAAKIEYTGSLDNTGIVVGNFKQAGQSFPLNLSREKIEKPAVKIEVEKKDTTYSETEVILETKTGRIFGTLTTPKKFSTIPVALIIAGSGPTDRDCNS